MTETNHTVSERQSFERLQLAIPGTNVSEQTQAGRRGRKGKSASSLGRGDIPCHLSHTSFFTSSTELIKL